MSDLGFTMCKICNITTECVSVARQTSFIFMLIFFSYRFIQSIRAHLQFSPGISFSRPKFAAINAICNMNTMISSYLYNAYSTTQGFLVYWILSAIASTLTGLNTDYRTDWGLISFDE